MKSFIIINSFSKPSALQRRSWSVKSDVWSFGVFCYELLSDGNLPFALVARESDVAQMVIDGQRLGKPDGCDDGLWTIVQSCWAAIPQQRPTFRELCSRLGSIHTPPAPDPVLAALSRIFIQVPGNHISGRGNTHISHLTVSPLPDLTEPKRFMASTGTG